MTGKQLKKKHPKFAKEHKINDRDCVYFDMDKIKILQYWDLKVIKTGVGISLA